MIRKLVKYLAYSMAAIIAIGCSNLPGADTSSDEEEKDSSSSSTGSLALQLAESSPVESMEIVDQTLSSVDQALEASAGSLIISLVEPSKYASKYCSEHGDPMHEASADFANLTTNDYDQPSEDGGMNANHENYASRLFHCKLRVNSESPETPRGAYSLVKGILCTASNNGGLDWDNPGVKDNVTLDFDEKCFGAKFVAEMSKNGATTASMSVETKVDENSEWGKSVKLSKMNFGGEIDTESYYEFSFKNSEQGLAVKQTSYEADKPFEKSGWVFGLDIDGTMRFERKSYRDPSLASSDDYSEVGTDLMRLLAKGTVEIEDNGGDVVTTKFSGIEKFEGIFMMAYNHPDSDLQGETSATVATIKGTSDAGFETRAYLCNNGGHGGQVGSDSLCDPMDGSTWTNISQINVDRGKVTCFPKSKSCDGVEALEFGKGKESIVMRVSSSSEMSKDPKAWIEGMSKPLSYESITWDLIQE